MIPGQIRRRRTPPSRRAAEPVHQHDGGALSGGLVAQHVAGQAYPRALSTWTPVGDVLMHARLLRPPGASVGPVAMIHGLGVSSASLSPLAERLAERHVTHVWDLPGFGLSRTDRIWSAAHCADAVALASQLRGVGRCVVVAHSWGCHVAALLARRHPGRVAALVMLSPAFDRRAGGLANQVVRLALDGPMERPELVLGAAADYLRAGTRRVLATHAEAAAIPLDALVADLPVPLLLVRGSRDPLTTTDWVHRIAARAPDARTALIPRAAHGLGHDAPGAVAGAIRAFLDAVRIQTGARAQVAGVARPSAGVDGRSTSGTPSTSTAPAAGAGEVDTAACA